MNIRNAQPLFLLAAALPLLLFTTQVTLSGCANIMAPMGGDKDSLPPVLVTARPSDAAKNVTGKKITLTFNEYIQLENASSQLIINPTPKVPPTVESKLKVLNITLKDTLEENTTYYLQFGDAIRDINENNILRNFNYVFATGNTIDSGSISGRVLVAENGKPDSTLLAVLYTKEDDSLVYKEKPRFVTRMKNDGSFRFEHLPRQTYYLYALKDESGTRRYLSGKQLFAFHGKPITIGDSSQPLLLYAYTERDTTPVKNSAKPVKIAATDKKLKIENNLSSGEQDLRYPLILQFKQAPLRTCNLSKLVLLNEKKEPITGFSVVLDSLRTQLTLSGTWEENKAYFLAIDSSFAVDTSGRKLAKADTLSFRTRKASSYGTVKLRFRNLDLQMNPVLLFIKEEKIVRTHIFTNNQFQEARFDPGEYELRILFDTNKNGLWDPGSFFGKKLQPEIVQPLKRKLNIKPNWDNEIDINL